MSTYETIKQAGYEYVEKGDFNEHILKNIHTGKFEIWFNNKNHASYALKFKNTHLEFVCS